MNYEIGEIVSVNLIPLNKTIKSKIIGKSIPKYGAKIYLFGDCDLFEDSISDRLTEKDLNNWLMQESDEEYIGNIHEYYGKYVYWASVDDVEKLWTDI